MLRQVTLHTVPLRHVGTSSGSPILLDPDTWESEGLYRADLVSLVARARRSGSRSSGEKREPLDCAPHPTPCLGISQTQQVLSGFCKADASESCCELDQLQPQENHSQHSSVRYQDPSSVFVHPFFPCSATFCATVRPFHALGHRELD